MTGVNEEIKRALFDTDNLFLKNIGEYVFQTDGKKIRPIIILLIAKALNNLTENHIKIAAAVELIHTATLIHDDIIDAADFRRHKETVNSKWGTDISILAGDFIFTKAYKLALQTQNPEVLRLICDITTKMCEGEISEIQVRNTIIDEQTYFKIISQKTAGLFSLCCEISAILSQCDNLAIKSFSEFGMNFGMAFQITDDALDFTSKSGQSGKDCGNDYKGGFFTLPIIHSLNIADNDDKKKILEILEHGNDFKNLLELIKKYNGIAYSLNKADEYKNKAIDSLKNIKSLNISYDDLEELSDFIIKRIY